MDPTTYDFKVLRLTSEISRQVFPLTIDLDNPGFQRGLDRLSGLSAKSHRPRSEAALLANSSKASGRSRRANFVRLYLLPSKANELPADIRLAPVW